MAIGERILARRDDADIPSFPNHPFAVGSPADIAAVILFLAAEKSRMVNGAVIAADGGISAY